MAVPHEEFSADIQAHQGRWDDLLSAGHLLPAWEAECVAQAMALFAWHRSAVLCPSCGGHTVPGASGWSRQCVHCASSHFPRTDPAAITAVIDDQDRLLLGSAMKGEARRYSTFAGFVEAGESVENAVVREVHEEAGITVERVEYFGSQSWPYPRSLMLGFFAYTRETGAAADRDEIRDVQWFSREELRDALVAYRITLPWASAMSHALITHWYGAELPEAPS
ncbi:NAD(+) diphosphatase [Nesterenkonia pannonica]|uniref:NAD(+) diphosphatase n=1 Tax=Nesterenkonia pannonica TaxID=1548602 RepID=UPI0021644A93|nr:NAD(+) diphosphatase [Nesterenkonia pannonica]